MIRHHRNVPLGGTITIVGHNIEGCVIVIALSEIPTTNLESLSIHNLENYCNDRNINRSIMIKENEFITALQKYDIIHESAPTPTPLTYCGCSW